MESSSKNFAAEELRCHCPKCNRQVPNLVQQKSLDLLQQLRDKVGRPLSLVSAYRCAEHPVEKRKTTPGQHNKGTAFDIAGKNKGDESSFISSIFTCIDIIRQRTAYRENRANPMKKLTNRQGKIISRRKSGCTAASQHAVTRAVKRARYMALLPYVGE